MSTQLRLEIHRITLQKLVYDSKRKRSEYVNQNFSELLGVFGKTTKVSLPVFWGKFIDFFKNQFVTNTDGDKAITATKNSKKSFSPLKNTINGEIDGGPTNREQSIYKRKNAIKSTGKVLDDDVVASNHFVKLWLPTDYCSGVLMIQSYSNANISDLVRRYFTKFVQGYKFRLIVSPCFPKEYEEKRRQESTISSVTYIKDHLSKDKGKLLNPLFADVDNLKIKIVISGFKKPVGEFWKFFKKDSPALHTNIDQLEIKADEDIAVIAQYTDENGRGSQIGIDKNKFRDFAYIYLNDYVKTPGKNTYDFNKIIEYTDGILEDVKKDIKYHKS